MDNTIDRDCACSLELGGPGRERNTPWRTFKKKRRAEKGRKGVSEESDITTKDGA